METLCSALGLSEEEIGKEESFNMNLSENINKYDISLNSFYLVF